MHNLSTSSRFNGIPIGPVLSSLGEHPGENISGLTNPVSLTRNDSFKKIMHSSTMLPYNAEIIKA